VFQDPYRSLNPRRPLRESLIEGPLNCSVSRDEAIQQATALVKLVGLQDNSLSRYPHEFSGGQRQRPASPRALLMKPTLLIVDEPVSALDVSVQARVLALLSEMRTRFNLAILFITHDLRVAAKISDRILVMQQGKIVEAGTARQIFTAPQHPYTKILLATAPGASILSGGNPTAARHVLGKSYV
jgi:peptide/nickel transport system ATP-binding protein